MTADESRTVASGFSRISAGRRRIAAPIRVGISACLLGQAVRFDGGHKRDAFLTETFGASSSGCRSVPRSSAASARRGNRCGSCAPAATCGCSPSGRAVDLTVAWRRYADAASRELAARGPVRLRAQEGLAELRPGARQGLRTARPPARTGRGLFARAPRALPRPARRGRRPPVTIRGSARTSSSGCSPTRAPARLLQRAAGPATLVRFHTAHKLLLLAHSPAGYRALGPAGGGGRGTAAQAAASATTPMAFMAAPVGDRHAAAARQRAAAHGRLLSARLDARRRRELAGRSPITGCGSCRSSCRSRCFVTTSALGRCRISPAQVYLEPHPKELMLRNHV